MYTFPLPHCHFRYGYWLFNCNDAVNAVGEIFFSLFHNNSRGFFFFLIQLKLKRMVCFQMNVERISSSVITGISRYEQSAVKLKRMFCIRRIWGFKWSRMVPSFRWETERIVIQFSIFRQVERAANQANDWKIENCRFGNAKLLHQNI